MRGPRRTIVATAALLTVGCAVAVRWLSPQAPTPADAALLLDEPSTDSLYKRMRHIGVPDIPPPQHLRPCYDFGYELKLRYAFLPILGYTITNLKTVDEIGPHDYDSGVVNMGSQGELVNSRGSRSRWTRSSRNSRPSIRCIVRLRRTTTPRSSRWYENKIDASSVRARIVRTEVDAQDRIANRR